MSFAFFIAAMVCLLGVAASLFAGMFAMAREGDKNRKASNKMMQARVILQGLTVLFLLLSYLAR
jgi:hypothetical protein